MQTTKHVSGVLLLNCKIALESLHKHKILSHLRACSKANSDLTRK